MERSLVTGSHGFLGNHLYQTLERQGQQVYRGDRLGNVPEKVDYIYDLASYGNLHGQNDLVQTYQANVSRLAQLLDNAKDYKGLVVTSSNSVKLPIGMYYQSSKLAAEGMSKLIATKGAPVAILRPFSVTGVGEQDLHLIPRLIRSCMYKEEIPFVPESAHDFIDVSDVATAYITVARFARSCPGQIFEAGWGVSVTNEQVKYIVEDVLNTTARVRIVGSLRSHDTRHYRADNDSLKALGWRPKIALEESIKAMVEKELWKD